MSAPTPETRARETPRATNHEKYQRLIDAAKELPPITTQSPTVRRHLAVRRRRRRQAAA